MKFKIFFESLSKIQKLEVYLIIIMTYTLIFVFYKDIYIVLGIYEEPKKELVITKLKQPLTNLNSLNHIEFVRYITKLSDESNIMLLETQIIKDYIEVKFDGSYTNVIHILQKFQNHFIIQKFNMQNDKDSIIANVVLDTKYFYNKKSKLINQKKIQNPFFKYEQTKNIGLPKMQVTAIIGSEVLLNDKWYKRNETLFTYKIVKINKNSIVLLDILTKERIIKEVIYE